MANKTETGPVIAKGRRLLRENRIHDAFQVLHPLAAVDRDVCELALQLAFPYSRILKLTKEDISILRTESRKGWEGSDLCKYLYAVYLIETRRGPKDVCQAKVLLESCYSNYLATGDIGDAIYLKALIHKFGWDGVLDPYRYADSLSLAYSDDSQRANMYYIGQRIYGTKDDPPHPEGAIAKLREVLHITKDEDIDRPGTTNNDLLHPGLWGLLSRAYNEIGNEDLARRAARREILEGQIECGELDLELIPCDPDDPLRELSVHNDPEPVLSTEEHLGRPWHSMKTYYPPRPDEERAVGPDGMTEMERRNAFNIACRDFPTPQQLKARIRAERKAHERAERERREKEEMERRLAALKGKPIHAIHVDGMVVAVDPGVLHKSPFSSVYATQDLRPGQDLLASAPPEIQGYISSATIVQAELDAVTFRYEDKEVTLQLGESFDSGEIGLSYAYAMFHISAK